MAKRKRGPPLSYEEKYKQIKQSGFEVDISTPRNIKDKALVTRYHRLLFGGFTRSGKYTRGIARNYKPTRTRHSEYVKSLWGVSGAARIKSAYTPKTLGTLVSATNKYLTFKNKQGTFKVLNVNPKELATMTPMERRTMLKKLTGQRVQVMIGTSIQGITFRETDSLAAAISMIVERYPKRRGVAPLRILVTT